MPLQDDLLALDIASQRVIDALLKKDVEILTPALADYESLRKSVRIGMLAQSVVAVDDPRAVAILRTITTGDGLPPDRLIKYLTMMSDGNDLSEEFSEEDLDKLGSELFYSWFSHFEYVMGLAELRPLVIRSPAGVSITGLVAQIKNCYAFQQYEAAYSLCRTLIEASIRDICMQRQLFPSLGDKGAFFEKYSWGHLRDKVSTGPLREQLRLLYSELSMVLHGRKCVAKNEARCAFEDTIHIIEELYAANGL